MATPLARERADAGTKGRIAAIVLLATMLVGVAAFLARVPPGTTGAGAGSSLGGAVADDPSGEPTLGPTPSSAWQSLAPRPSSGGPDGGGPGASPGNPPTPQPVALGAFIWGASSNPKLIDAYARMTGAMPRIVMWYQAWASDYSGFSTSFANAVRSRGATPMVSWEPSAGPTNDPNWTLATIISGKHDAYIRSWTHAVAAWGHELYVRLMYEMNGNWAPWCVNANGNSPIETIQAWRHVVDIARAQGATNIRWVWSPNVNNDGLGLPFVDLYPGDAYVDWVALDAYNFDDSTHKFSWPYYLYSYSLSLIRNFTNKPFFIAEIGCTQKSYKPNWVSRVPAASQRLGAKAVVWFNENMKKEWRLDSSAATLSAAKTMVHSSNVTWAGRWSLGRLDQLAATGS